MHRVGCKPDHVIYKAIVEALWDTGLQAAQHRAVALYRQGVAAGCLLHTPPELPDVSLGAVSSSVAMINMLCWLADLREKAVQEGPASLPDRVVLRVQGCTPDVVTHTALITAYGKGGQWRRALQVFERMHQVGCKPDHVIYKAVVEALWDTGLQAAQHRAVALYRQGVAAGCLVHTPPELSDVSLGAVSSSVAMINMLCWLADLRAPFTVSAESNSSLMRLEAAGVQLADWLDSPGLDAALQPYTSAASSAALRPLQETSFDAELVLEAFQVVQEFEESHGLSVATMGQMYITSRRDLVLALFKVGASLGVGQDALHDAVLLMDRAMSSEGQIRNN
ncbi:pentatricopeptide repeat-containing isoform A, partial [Haematococcus lacustris]